METNSFDWKNKKDRDDFIIALLVLAFFGWLIFQFGFNRGIESPVAEIANIVEADAPQIIADDVDTDNDGVMDSADKCPMTAGYAMYNGCPNDGTVTAAAVAAPAAAVVAPPKDSDGDGVSDARDKCPTQKGVRPSGCPDSDGDGVIDANDKCPKLAGATDKGGCPPDADGDGVYDANDKCPNKKGTVANQGCPGDKDRDGVVDSEDACPNVKGLKRFKGCPDTDNDGVVDSKDKCPSKAGPAANNGCPEEIKLSTADQKIIDDAIKNVEFRTGSAQLKNSSASILTKLAGLLKKYPDYKLTISGHTDNDGKPESNLILSEKRALSCLNFLKTQGINASRMVARGFGDSQPKASNKTATGKRQNRRVEFELKN